MMPAARVAAAIDVLGVIDAQHRPASEVLKEWGSAHRFAGSKDRAAIASLVYDCERVRASAAWIMGEATPRAQMLGALREMRALDAAAIADLCSGEGHAPAPLTDQERARLADATLVGAPAHVAADIPEWLGPAFAAAYGDHAIAEGRAMATRAPVDLRVNTLKGDRDKAARALAHLDPAPCPLAPDGLRVAFAADGRAVALSAEPAYARGLVEIQDEGSQVVARLTGAQPGWQVLDLCAGGGGKTLALAALMANKGQIYASDVDGRRLTPIFDRLERAGVRNVQVRAPRGARDVLADLSARCDLVLVDAPCTGTGTWRRNPDAKWRIRPSALALRVREQDEALDRAAGFVKPGGVLFYVTCSVLIEENEARVAAFLERHPEYLPLDAAHMARKAGMPTLAAQASTHGVGLRLSPRATGTDGFYIAGLGLS